MLRKDLEYELTAKLSSLSNEDAQRIAEDFVRIRHPERFPYFAFRAFSPQGKSRPGWPDAFSVGSDGRYEGVEATHVASHSGVINHLNEYLEKATALRADQLAGFLHVSISPKVSFRPHEIREWTEKFVAAGFRRDRVELVFGQGLVEILTRPEFARTRMEILGVDDLPNHFRLYRSKVGPDENRLGTHFIPSWEDYEEGRIHQTELAKRVTEKLSSDRAALVRGIGASGKTVLAWQIAQEVLNLGFPAFFFDFAADRNSTRHLVNALISDIKRFGHPKVLFVLDNIHVEETSAKEVFLAWHEIPSLQQPQILLVGRETRTAKGSSIEGLKFEALSLRARQAELRGVFRRLALRSYTGGQLPEPPEAVLTNWLRTFGGKPENPKTTADLIVFSAAVFRRMRDLLHGRWRLTEADAVEQVRDVYLGALSPPETANLARLCVAERLEIAIEPEVLAFQMAALTMCNTKLGIVFRDETGGRRHSIRYRLAHPALGELLMAGMENVIDRMSVILEMASVSARFGGDAASRLMSAGQLEDAQAVMLTTIDKSEKFLGLYSFFEVESILRLAKRLKIELPESFDHRLAAKGRNSGKFEEIAFQTQFDHLVSFLRYAEESLPAVFNALSSALADAKNHPQLAGVALDTQLDHLVSFLRYAKESLPEVFTALSSALANVENQQQLAEVALETQLDHLVSFLRYAKESLPEVFTALSSALANVENQQQLAEVALETPLEHLVTFLRYAEKPLPTVFDTMSSALQDAKNQQQLAEVALDTPLDHLVSFLRYAKESLPEVFTALSSALANVENQQQLAEVALDTPLENLVSFLRYAEKPLPTVFDTMSSALQDAKNQQQLAEVALETPLEHLVTFLRYAEKPLPTVFDTMSSALEDAKNQQQLAEVALETPLQHLVSFLRYAEKPLPTIFGTISSALEDAKNQAQLAETALNLPLHFLVGFLRFLEEKLPEPFKALRTELEKTENLTHLVEKARNSPSIYVLGLQRYAETSMPMLSSVLSTELQLPGQPGLTSIARKPTAALE
ncbi:hypothetical protein HGO38_30860 [Rhizobium sp. CG5]|uniref:hypothetical protein n=1 Tax=Rhizobium sp. CG5 TaxID=2726076 RepID=UPI002033B6D9|nr:hypothetical protein [Rhizobium sp. CG5]MCM2477849.1 hypothetical protein [Rhizobium sp. CG5]